MPKVPAIAAAFSLLAIAVPAQSQEAPKSRTISLADLDLSQARDQRMLTQRVARATETVCGSYANVRQDEEDRITACRKAVSSQVQARLASLGMPQAAQFAAR